MLFQDAATAGGRSKTCFALCDTSGTSGIESTKDSATLRGPPSRGTFVIHGAIHQRCPQVDVTHQLGGPPHGDCAKKPRNFSRESNKNAQHGA
jgi:hypothetical protein